MTLTTVDKKLITEIARRAVAFYKSHDMNVPAQFIIVELCTVHQEIVPLRLADMLASDDANFMHDIAGIHKHLRRDREVGLTDGFMPRFADIQFKEAIQ